MTEKKHVYRKVRIIIGGSKATLLERSENMYKRARDQGSVKHWSPKEPEPHGGPNQYALVIEYVRDAKAGGSLKSDILRAIKGNVPGGAKTTGPRVDLLSYGYVGQ